MAVINVDDIYILGETGKQVDKVTGLFTKDEDTTSGEKAFAQLNIGTAGSNRNLFDNPFFTINQRGLTSYSAGYSVDRWVVTSNASINVLSNGIELTTTANRWGMEQRCVKNLIPHGTTVTFSALIDDGEIVQKSFVWNGASITVYPDGADVGLEINTAPTAYDRWYVCNTIASTHTIHAVKIEFGSVSTLANDAPPDYWQELDKCLYYFERITSSTSGPLTIGAGFADGVHYLYVPVRIHRKRAGIATISTSGAIYAGQQSSNIAVSSVKQYNSSPDGIITLLANAPSSFTNNGYYRLALGVGAHIDFSADL